MRTTADALGGGGGGGGLFSFGGSRQLVGDLGGVLSLR
jgi:hypothetical protein